MIYLTLMFLLLVGFPVAAVVLWQRRFRSSWTIVLFALVAFAVNFLLQELASPIYNPISEAIIPLISPPYQMAFFLPWIAIYFVGGLIREGVHWLTIRYGATSVRSWRDGMMFGIVYGSIVMVLMLGRDVYKSLEFTGLFTPTLEFLVAGGQKPSFNEIMETLKNDYHWTRSLLLFLSWGMSSMIFNIGTCLIVVFSVQKKSVIYFLAAVVMYVAYTNARSVVMHSDLVNIQVDWMIQPFTTAFVVELGVFVFALPCLLAIFLLRKPMSVQVAFE
ncbi:MAG: YhfC family glutamic-type intramembrane protease [Chloroflexi bacterium]|nr:YhfC family glutamic-type intramembrane protease [Chloroflexota bacterium]